MIEFNIGIAGRVAAVSAMYESTRKYCENFLTREAPDFAVSVTAADIAFERQKAAREDQVEGLPPRQYSDPYLEIIAVQRKITQKLFEYDTLLFHGSVVAVDGDGYLFTAKSGTGKSTHTRLWRRVLGDRAVMVNDDKPFLRITPEGVFACGSPWNGKHKLGGNLCVPLKAVCVLQRGGENRIRAVPAADVLQMLFQQSSRPMDARLMPKYMELIDGLAGGVSFYRLWCNMDPEAALVAFGAMSAGGKEDQDED